LAVVPLTTLRQPAFDLGVASANVLLAEAQEPNSQRQHLTYSPQLVVRDSTGSHA
jgi:LacI family transcriptional regulator